MTEEKIEIITSDEIKTTEETKKSKYSKKTERLNWKSFYCAEKKIPKYVREETKFIF